MSSKNMIKTDLGDVKPVVEAGGKNSVYFLPNLNVPDLATSELSYL